LPIALWRGRWGPCLRSRCWRVFEGPAGHAVSLGAGAGGSPFVGIAWTRYFGGPGWRAGMKAQNFQARFEKPLPPPPDPEPKARDLNNFDGSPLARGVMPGLPASLATRIFFSAGTIKPPVRTTVVPASARFLAVRRWPDIRSCGLDVGLDVERGRSPAGPWAWEKFRGGRSF